MVVGHARPGGDDDPSPRNIKKKDAKNLTYRLAFQRIRTIFEMSDFRPLTTSTNPSTQRRLPHFYATAKKTVHRLLKTEINANY